MEYNTTTAFHTRKNNYNSSPIDLATKIHQFCLEDKSVDLWLFSGEVLEKSERKYCNLLSGKYSTYFTHCPSQMEILLFLGKMSEMMADSSTVLQTIKRKNGWWMFNLCQYTKIKEDVKKPVLEDKEEKSFANTKRKTDSISSGFEQIDKITGGLKKGEITILATRPAVGKTAFATDVALHISGELGKAVGFFSLDMSRETLYKRMLMNLAKSNEIKKTMLKSKILANFNLFTDDTPFLTADEISLRSKKLSRNLCKKGKKLEIIIIDYLGLIGKKSGEDNPSYNLSILKNLATSLDIPVLVLSQIHRRNPNKLEKYRRPIDDLSNHFDCSDVDCVYFIKRDFLKEDENKTCISNADFIIAKHPIEIEGKIGLTFYKEYLSFHGRNSIP